MSWVKLDDQFFRNPKMIEAGKDARALYVAGLCHCAAGLTDGWVSTKALLVIASDAQVKPSTVRVLETFGLWEENVGGWWIHDYLEYNPRAEDVKRIRRARADAGRRGGQATAQASAVANGEASATAKFGAPLEPRPVPSRPGPVPMEGQDINPLARRNSRLRAAGGAA